MKNIYWAIFFASVGGATLGWYVRDPLLNLVGCFLIGLVCVEMFDVAGARRR